MFRIGYGYDVHELRENRDLILGGVKIPFSLGLYGHSDADVLLHAITDALLGALALGDIGSNFPDTDNSFKNIDSRILLRRAFERVKHLNYKINNLDATICAQKPKLRDFIIKMQENIAFDLETSIDNISIKATTEEKLGISGSEKGMTAHCIVLLVRS